MQSSLMGLRPLLLEKPLNSSSVGACTKSSLSVERLLVPTDEGKHNSPGALEPSAFVWSKIFVF